MRRHLEAIIALACAVTFILLVSQRPIVSAESASRALANQVVIDAPLQVLLYGGDRFLAANIEGFRTAAAPSELTASDAGAYRIRSHHLVSRLNPCHEDNYYLANALLTWGGAEEEGSKALRAAIDCRFWDYVPAFFHGFNQYFFYRNLAEAHEALTIAAQRSPENAATLKKLAIMIAAEQINDEKMALDYLRQQQEQARDSKLKHMLARRVTRLEGLVLLRQAQERYEQQFGRPLTKPEELLQHNILQEFPADPLGIGYEFRDGKFHMGKLKIKGVEERE